MLSEPFNYINDFNYSMENNELFWEEINNKYNIKWFKKYDQILYKNSNKYEWFKNGLINACYNCLDINLINGRNDEIAFVHEIPIKKIKFEITYQELYDKVCLFSKALLNNGVKKGDYIMIYMHNSFEAIVSMLSCARIGAIHNVIYSGTLLDTLLMNIEDCKPKLIITSTFCYLLNDEPWFYLSVLKDALELSNHQPNNIIIYKRKDIVDIETKNIIFENSLDWDEIIKNCGEPFYDYIPVESNHPLYLIYTSGTTNKPKGIIRDTAGHIVTIKYITDVYYGLNDGDVFYTSSNIGWICSHSFLVYGCLMARAKSVFLEGPYNDISKDIWDIIDRNKVNAFLITPSTARKIQKIDPSCKSTENFNLSTLKHISIGSERVDISIQKYLTKLLKKEVLIEYWQSESGYQMLINGQFPIKSNSLGKAVPGFKFKVISYDNINKEIKELGPNEIGELVVELPLPPCFVNKLLNDDKDSTLYDKSYIKYNGYFSTGDLVYYDNENYYYFISRVSDSIYVGCDTINCSILESKILNNNPCINDCSIIGLKDEILNEIPLVLIVLKNEILDNTKIDQIKYKISKMVSNIIQIGIKVEPVITIVKNLPKNRNGKSLKPLLYQIFNDQSHKIPSNIDNIQNYYQLLNDYHTFKNNKDF